ncbi:MAG: cobalamin biosynthesis protein CbiX [Alphaproteobacteria bacterium CG11_big_fil_rev_8_21_14_0_20_39_49]|nr:MAG: cobalamin biosynthesis protein CbiX [Alphaproteobacteria bacterium CG11_big_fil_rev_8_21_14_0_20_39_49]
MKYLLLVAHGSRREESNDEVRQLAKKLNDMQHGFDEVGAAFLELAEPLIPEGIINAVDKGATEVVVMPYFLSAGRHVVSDVPSDVESVKAKYPHIKITLAPYIGSSPKLLDVILEMAEG